MYKIKDIHYFNKVNEAEGEWVYDQYTKQPLFQSMKAYTPSEFIKIMRKSTEGKKPKGSSNFLKGMYALKRLRKELPIRLVVKAYRSAWNYGDNLCLVISSKDIDEPTYSGGVFKFNSGNSTRTPDYMLGDYFSGLRIPGRNEPLETGNVGYGSYKSISNIEGVVDDIVNVFKAYEQKYGKPFNAKDAKKFLANKNKIWNDWNKMKPKLEKLYYSTKELARKVNSEIEMSFPKLSVKDREVGFRHDEPRELRHPDEYGEYVEKMMSTKQYYKYQENIAKIDTMLEKFAKKHNLEYIHATSW